MGKNNRQGMSVGVVSLITIFVVFLLASLAVLSLSTANAGVRNTQRVLTTQQAYYAADAQAQNILAQIDALLAQGQRTPQAFLAIEGVTVNPEGELVYQVAINASSVLSVRLALTEDSYQIEQWQVENTAEWQKEDKINNLWEGNE